MRAPRLRIRALQILFVAGFAALCARAAYLCLDDRGQARGHRQLQTAMTLAPERGQVVDRHGEVLAVSVPTPSLYAVPEAIDDKDRVATTLARELGVSRAYVRARLSSNRPFVFIKRWLNTEVAQRIARLELPGIGSVDESRRVYPLGAVAGPLLGFANIDGIGVRGVERLENDWLLGTRVRARVERDARGRLLVGPGLDAKKSSGGDIALTLDTVLQAHAEVALADAIRRSGARGGFVITLDPASGDVLALAEAPRFDPNHFRRSVYTETRSRVFVDAMEPGSTLKAFLAAAALDSGAVDAGEHFDLSQGVRVPGKWIRDKIVRPELDLAGILRVSSNAGAVRVAQRLGAKDYYEALRRFGFGAVTGSGFPEESAGILRRWEEWRPLDQATVAYGQGVSVTPMQLATATAALAAEGRLRAPRLIAARRAPGGSWKSAPPGPSREVVRPAAARRVSEMLMGVTQEGGTATRAALDGIAVAGKTGTAQKFDRAQGRYSEDRMIAWFAGYAPAQNPRVALVVGLDEPAGEIRSGGAVAAPLFAQVAAAHLTYLGTPTRPLRGWPGDPEPRQRVAAAPTPAVVATAPAVVSAAPAQAAKAAPLPERPARRQQWIRVGERVFLPDLVGLGRSDLDAFARETSLRLAIEGDGHVITQDPPAGSILAAGGDAVRIKMGRP